MKLFAVSTLSFLASASIVGLTSVAQAANLGDPDSYTGDASTNFYGYNIGGTRVLYTDPSPGIGGAICDPITSGGSLANCNGDEYFSIDFTPDDGLPFPITGPNFGVVDGSLPLPFGAEVVPGTSSEYVYATSAGGVLSEFISPSSFDLRGSIGSDLLLGAFTNPAPGAFDVATIPMTLFLDMDSPTVPPNFTLDEPPADLFYLTGISQATIREEAAGSSLSISLFGMYAQADRTGPGFGEIDEDSLEFLFNGEQVITFQFAGVDAEELGELLVNTGRTGVPITPASTSVSADAVPKDVPEPSSILGLISILGAGMLVNKKRQK